VATGSATEDWQVCGVEFDDTAGMCQAGNVQLHLPGMEKKTIFAMDGYWLRVRIIKDEETPKEENGEIEPYELSPMLRQLESSTVGGAVHSTHGRQAIREYLGLSDGTPGQRLYLQHQPLLERRPDECMNVEVEGQPKQSWMEVTDFGNSSNTDLHYTLDSVSGEICLGPAIRQPDGSIRQYGAVPPLDARLYFSRYRYGGGHEGNVAAGVLNVLKTAIPYVDQVENRSHACGGLDAESLEYAQVRMPEMLRCRERAVTEADYEFLARQALPSAIGRVRCLQPCLSDMTGVTPGRVYVLVIPRVPEPVGYLPPEQLELPPAEVEALGAFLDERRLLTAVLNIRPPAYYPVVVRVRLRPMPGAKASAVETNVLERLYRFLNPLIGGPEGTGWPFGRDLYAADVFQCLRSMSDVQFIQGLTLRAADKSGCAHGDPVERVEVQPYGVIVSGKHEVEFV
jgi:predicted phage baseplate assembly protein